MSNTYDIVPVDAVQRYGVVAAPHPPYHLHTAGRTASPCSSRFGGGGAAAAAATRCRIRSPKAPIDRDQLVGRRFRSRSSPGHPAQANSKPVKQLLSLRLKRNLLPDGKPPMILPQLSVDFLLVVVRSLELTAPIGAVRAGSTLPGAQQGRWGTTAGARTAVVEHVDQVRRDELLLEQRMIVRVGKGEEILPVKISLRDRKSEAKTNKKHTGLIGLFWYFSSPFCSLRQYMFPVQSFSDTDNGDERTKEPLVWRQNCFQVPNKTGK